LGINNQLAKAVFQSVNDDSEKVVRIEDPAPEDPGERENNHGEEPNNVKHRLGF
jgi:hypothetical protein